MAGTVITQKGLQLMAKLIASKASLQITRASVGTGSVPSGYNPAAMLDLSAYKMDGVISHMEADGEEAHIVMQLSSVGVKTGFIITEAGIFCEDPDEGEILYAYLDLFGDPQYLYAEGSAISKFVEITMGILIGAVESVTAQLNPSALITREEYEKCLERLAELEKVSGERGRVLIGAASTQLQTNDTLFVIEDEPSPSAFEGAAYTNMVFSTDAPTGAENWGKIESAPASTASVDGAPSIIQGNLTVAEEPTPGTVFFAKINKKGEM